MTDDEIRALTVSPYGLTRNIANAALEARAELATVKADKAGLQAQVSKLLSMLDAWDTERANDVNGGLTMHTYGQTPDWFVEAAYWSCYGFGPTDARAALQSSTITQKEQSDE